MENNKKLNALGAFEDLKLFDKDGNRVYEFICLSNGYWRKSTYDSDGNQLTFEDSNGFWVKSTYDSNGRQLTCEDSHGYWYKSTYDSNGNQLTFERSDGLKRGFNTPEHTMDELIEKLGYNFTIIKQTHK